MEFTGIYLTQYEGAILGPVAKLLGYLMDWIFNGLYAIGIPNIGIAIILFTIVIYMLMLPLTIKQQKFSKLSAKMNPEIQAIQSKYKLDVSGIIDTNTIGAINLEIKNENYTYYFILNVHPPAQRGRTLCRPRRRTQCHRRNRRPHRRGTPRADCTGKIRPAKSARCWRSGFPAQ